MSGKLILTVGIPGCGKSTWANQIKDNDPENVIVVERDQTRSLLFGDVYHTRNPIASCEDQVTKVNEELIRNGLSAGKTVICSDTNINGRVVNSLVKLARKHNAPVELEYFNVPAEECKRRNKARGAAGGREVPERVMDLMIQRAYGSDGNLKEALISQNGTYFVERITPGMKILEDFNKKQERREPFKGKAVVLVDLDGTLAKNKSDAAFYLNYPGRKKDFPGFYKSIRNSEVNAQVRDLANKMREDDNLNIIVLTGRDDSYVSDLLSFVERSELRVSRVIAKRDGDMRPDGEYKSETLEKLKAEGLVVVHAIDDRPSSIAAMEKAGIMVSRVHNERTVITDGMTEPPPSKNEPVLNSIYGSGYCIRCGSALKSGGNIGPRCATKI